MIIVKIKAAGAKHVCQVLDAWKYSDEYHFEALNKRAIATGEHSYLMRPGDGKKPRKGSCINARKFLEI